MASTSTTTDDDLLENTNHKQSLENDLPTLYITSFGHRRGPLVPTPHVSIDSRTLPNPPKNVRDGQTGLSKHLKDWLFSNEEVQSRFNGICNTIQARLDDAQKLGEQEVTVGICCQLGRHRSVAVVEELSRARFEGWNVAVAHRDAHRRHSPQKERRRRGKAELEDC